MVWVAIPRSFAPHYLVYGVMGQQPTVQLLTAEAMLTTLQHGIAHGKLVTHTNN